MRTSVLATVLALGLVLALSWPMTVAAQNGEDEDEDEEGEEEDDDEGENEEEERKVVVSVDSDGIEIQLKRESAETEDKVEMSFDVQEAEFEVKFEGEEGDQETEMKLQAEFHHLVEYRDEDGDGSFDVGEPMVSAWALGGEGEDEGMETNGTVDWGVPSVEDESADNQSGKRITANASFGEQGTFGLVFHVFGDFVDLGNSSLRPTSVKIDILIEEYPYAADDTALALLMETQAKTEIEVEHDHEELDEDEEGVAAIGDVDGEPVALFFTWKDHATVDGQEQPVGTTLIESKEESETDDGESEVKTKERFALSYARGASILHDPEAFVVAGSQEDASSMPGVGMAPALVAMALAAAVAGLRSVRRR